MHYTKEQIFASIRPIVADKSALSEEYISLNTVLQTAHCSHEQVENFDVGIDSLDFIEVIVDTEKAFSYDLKFPDKEVEKIGTVEDLVDLVYKLQNQ